MEWYNVFNKGIPTDKAMGFTLDIVGQNCSTNNEKFIKAVTEELVELNDIIENETGSKVPIRKGLFAITMDENLEQHLTFNPQIYILSLLDYLDSNVSVQSEMLESKLVELAKKRLHELKNIKYSVQLEKSFPTLYEEYKFIEDKYNDMVEMRKRYVFGKKLGLVDEEAYQRNLEKYKELFAQFGLNMNTVNVKAYVEHIYKKCMQQLKPELYDKITDLISSIPISMDKFDDCLDKEKFELLMACSALSNANFNKEDAISNISYLTQYFREHEDDMDSDISVIMYMNGEDKTLTRKDLYKLYKEFLINNPEVKIVRKTREDFVGKSYEDILAYLNSFKGELEVSWDILPSGESLFERTRSSESTLTDEERKQKEANKERILQEKEDFFNNNKPYLLLKGKNSFLGYIGYIYPNAYVVLEKFFKNKKGTSIAEDAIYIMKVEEFLDLSMKSRPEIIENHLCHRVTHHRGWQGKVIDFLRKEATEDTIERVQIFENQIRHLN